MSDQLFSRPFKFDPFQKPDGCSVDTFTKFLHFCRELVVDDIHDFEDKWYAGCISADNSLTIVVLTADVLWTWTHHGTNTFVPMLVLESPTSIHLIQGARRAQKMRHYMYLKLEVVYAKVRAGLDGWNRSAIEKAMSVLAKDMKRIAKREDKILAELKATMTADQQEEIDERLRIFDEGWLQVAGVPVGRTHLDI